MARCVCPSLVFVLLSGVVCADVLWSEPLQAFPTSATEQTATFSIMQSSTDGIMASAPTSTEVTSGPTIGPATTLAPTTHHTNATTLAPTTHHTNATTLAPTTHHTNATTLAPTTHHTNATTLAPTTHHTNATTLAPTTHHTNATTLAPTTHHTNATTLAPTTHHTNATTLAPTTTSPPLPNPDVGDYSVRADNSSVCLMAKMGLQFSFTPNEGESVHTVNLDPRPNVTVSSGTCGSHGSDAVLTLVSDTISVQFTFANQTNKFHLKALNFTVDIGNGSTFEAVNVNLSLWEASLGSSYMCRKEQTFNITGNLALNTFELQVQPFGVINNKFSTAEDCQDDQTDNFIIPIAVGVALIVLVAIVLVAYFIGRRRSQTSAEECFLDADLSFLVPIAVGVALGFLIILVLISYLIGRRKSRTGYQSV